MKFSKSRVFPLEKKALEAIVQISDSPSKPLQSSLDIFLSKKKKDKLLAAQEEIKILKKKNQVLKQKNATLSSHLTIQMDELADECNELRRSVRNKGIQRTQLVNMYKRPVQLTGAQPHLFFLYSVFYFCLRV